MKKKIAIIGAGWFGCHIASEIIKLNKFDVQIFEKNNEIFEEASTNNQNRLHLGFHYPRSKETRTQSKKGFKKFLGIYPFLCSKVKNNIYFFSSLYLNFILGPVLTEFESLKLSTIFLKIIPPNFCFGIWITVKFS